MLGNNRKKLFEKFRSSWGQPKSEEFDFTLIDHYFRKKDHSDVLQTISNQTINDLDFYSLFKFTDRTSSKIGQQFLFDRLLTIDTVPDFDAQEQLIGHFTENEQIRLETQCILSRLNDNKSLNISWLFLEDIIETPKSLLLIKLLSIISLLAFMALLVTPTAVAILIGLFAVNLFLHYANKKHIEKYSDSIPRFSLLCRCVRDLLKINLPTMAGTAVVSSLESIEKIKNRMSVFTLESKQNADPITGLLYMLIEYIKIQLLLEPIIVFSALRHLREKRKDIQNLYEFFGRVDSAIAIASLRHGVKYYCIPQIKNEHEGIGFNDLYHPLVPDCVANSMDTKGRSILLTGSNMSGKTTFIRSVAINTLYAQTINTCFASSLQLSPMRIYSAIRISDDVLSGKSYYFEEVLTINEMVKESRVGAKTLFLLDELFKGTNTIERIAAGKAVLSYICNNGSTVFVSTHDIELTGLLNSTYDLFHFTEVVVDSKVHFDYKLKSGALRTRNAIKILEINGYPKALIEEAKEISNRIAGYSL